MSTQRVYQIERFYFGNLIQNGQPVGKPTVIARSEQVTQPIVQQCLKVARVKPPDLNETNADMPSTLALFRGGELGYIMVKSQRTPEGFPQLLYLIIPDLALRWLGGNYNLFESSGYQEMRTFDAPRYDLTPLKLEDPQPLTTEEQVSFLYDLYFYCGDNIKNVESVLAALIHNEPLAIYNAPQHLQKRLGFIQGLLSLLPTPARVAMTWATHTDQVANTPAQINFVTNLEHLSGYTVYDWGKGQLLSEPIADKYSKFITSQLRLDASLVVETTTSIAKTAVWRAMRKDSLAQALHFASRRAAIDSAVMNNQPADRETVADILRQDPTLTEELRLKYARHLLAFTLALGDEFHHADVLPVVAAADRPVAETLYNQLKDTAEEPKNALNVLELIERWMVNIPQATVIPWQQVSYIAAKHYLEYVLSQGKTKKAVDFLARLQKTNRALHMENAVPQLIRSCWSAAAYDAPLALAIFLLAAEYLPLENFHQIVTDNQLVGQLPQHVQQALLYLQPQPRPNPPRNLLISVVSELEVQQRMLVMGRLAELAVHLKREELLDTRILEGLLRAVQSGYAWRFGSLIQYLATKYSHPDRLQELDRGARELLPHLYFSTGQYETGVRLLEQFQNMYYQSNTMPAFTDLCGAIFLNSSLPLESLERVFGLIEYSKIRPEPRTRAYTSVLVAAEWGQAYKNIARRLTLMLFNDVKLVEVMGLDNLLKLLAFHLQSRDAISIQETSDVLLSLAVGQGKRGVELVLKMWDFFKQTPELSAQGINFLRRYVRSADAVFAGDLADYFDNRLGQGLGSTLRATYAMRRLMAGRDLMDFTRDLEVATHLLVDISTAYQPGKETPPKHRIRQGLDSMSGGLEEAERDMIGDNIAQIAQTVFILGTRQNRGKQTEEFERSLLRNEALPQTALDFLILLGGIFAKRQKMVVDLSRESMTHVLGNRSAVMLRDESAGVANFLQDLMTAFPPNNPPKFDLEALNAEIDNLWQQLSLYNQRQVQDSLASNTQYLAQVMTLIAHQAKEAAFKNPKLRNGQAVPSNEIEAMLWISGYFKHTHTP